MVLLQFVMDIVLAITNYWKQQAILGKLLMLPVLLEVDVGLAIKRIVARLKTQPSRLQPLHLPM